MSRIDPATATVIYRLADLETIIVYDVPDVSDGDTLDLSSAYTQVIAAIGLGSYPSPIVFASGSTAAAIPTIRGTQLMFDQGFTRRRLYLMVTGYPA